jgi:serine protease AprX
VRAEADYLAGEGPLAACPLCGAPTPANDLTLVGWQPEPVIQCLTAEHPGWRRADGACPACVQRTVLRLLLEQSGTPLGELVQSVWPLDAEAAFGAIPTPHRLRADLRFTGRGVTVAQVDAGFYPHPDLVQPVNRLRAWFDAARPGIAARFFGPDEVPVWPGWDARTPPQWHGLMTTTTLAGNGFQSQGLYRGLASEADLVLVQVLDDAGRITNSTISRALRWLAKHRAALGLDVVSLSVGGDPVMPLRGNEVDLAVADLVAAGVVVVAASGNDGARRLVPPATAPEAITVGGLDDHNNFDPDDLALWHSNYGPSTRGTAKPEVVAPSLWVVAPLLPGTAVAAEAADLFRRRAAGDAGVDRRIAELKLVTPDYQHVEGTSFAAPIVASLVACVLEVNPTLSPAAVRTLLQGAAVPIPEAPPERQGAGAVDAGRAIAAALTAPGGGMAGQSETPFISAETVHFLLHDRAAHAVRLFGSWDGWGGPGQPMVQVAPGLWSVERRLPPPGRYGYKFLLDGRRWLDDPLNPHKVPDGVGAFNSILHVPARRRDKPVAAGGKNMAEVQRWR